ncbi:hypothetical protein GCM10017774_12720 [Lentzea cavernae]|uniref:Uncharacterized protein n=1 Tax=Lentzea cavernae TaxID=2020703 RepID=A0ABQ3M4A8_9PSEU|nr:hypothetical protein GCM10017774_12720 [Lentzea cavernae]
MTSTFHNEIQLDNVYYRLSATVDSEESLVLDLIGTTGSGQVVADGRLRLPVVGGATVGKLLTRVLHAHTRLQVRPATRHANATLPWTTALDNELREAWLRPGARGAVRRINDLAERLHRSPSAIRARLSKVGCDPDVPTRELSEAAAEVLRVKPKEARASD